MLRATVPLQYRYRGLAQHGTLREWALRMDDKDIAQWDRRGQPVPSDALRLMRDADNLVAATRRAHTQGRAPPPRNTKQHTQMRTADVLVKYAPKHPSATRTARLREALRLYYRASQRADGLLPVLGSRILGTSRLLEHRIRRTADALDRAQRAHLHAPPTHDQVQWGLRDRVRTPPECAAVPAATARVPSPGGAGPTLAYKPRALPGLPPLPLSALQHAALPLLRAFPAVGGRANLSLGHAASAEAGLLGTRGSVSSSARSSVSSSGQGARQGGHGVPSPPDARADAGQETTPPLFPRRPPTAAHGKVLRWFTRSPARFRLMLEHYPARPAPLPPLPPLPTLSPLPLAPGGEQGGIMGEGEGEPPSLSAWRNPAPRASLAHTLRLRLGGRLRGLVSARPDPAFLRGVKSALRTLEPCALESPRPCALESTPPFSSSPRPPIPRSQAAIHPPPPLCEATLYATSTSAAPIPIHLDPGYVRRRQSTCAIQDLEQDQDLPRSRPRTRRGPTLPSSRFLPQTPPPTPRTITYTDEKNAGREQSPLAKKRKQQRRRVDTKQGRKQTTTYKAFADTKVRLRLAGSPSRLLPNPHDVESESTESKSTRYQLHSATAIPSRAVPPRRTVARPCVDDIDDLGPYIDSDTDRYRWPCVDLGPYIDDHRYRQYIGIDDFRDGPATILSPLAAFLDAWAGAFATGTGLRGWRVFSEVGGGEAGAAGASMDSAYLLRGRPPHHLLLPNRYS
ncbi:hypothetical protein C8R44DRAFT_986715 [Mycena epipterygia]|nr:hypothetical protein C8R44DRAFT_986715 [Mycena epipterygia]